MSGFFLNTFSSSYVRFLVSGIFLLAIALFFNYRATQFAATHAGPPVEDIILDHIPVVNMEFMIVEGALLLVAAVLFFIAQKPQRAPFLLKATALFVIIRAFFLILTHLGPYSLQSHLSIDSWVNYLGIGFPAALFFSGHTGMPFLMALIFWNHLRTRIFFLVSSGVMGCAVLLAHVHYSIDVFAAFFITYTIFILSTRIFRPDFELFHR
jgi:membrane-associated phospholipid phosphatase